MDETRFEPVIEILSEPSPADEAAILARLIAYNEEAGGPARYTPFNLVVRHPESGEAIGGMVGSSGYDWLYIDLFVIPKEMRRQGFGSRLIAMAEAEARRRGCIGIWLDTYIFQARPFYEKHGFVCCGEILDHPRGGARYFMQKRLDGAPLQR